MEKKAVHSTRGGDVNQEGREKPQRITRVALAFKEERQRREKKSKTRSEIPSHIAKSTTWREKCYGAEGATALTIDR